MNTYVCVTLWLICLGGIGSVVPTECIEAVLGDAEISAIGPVAMGNSICAAANVLECLKTACTLALRNN